MALFDCALSILHPHTASYFASGKTPIRTGNAHPNITPYDISPTASNPIFLAVGNDGQVKKLCAGRNAPDMASDPRYTTNSERSANGQALKHKLIDLLEQHDGQELVDRLIRAGVPCSSVLSIPQALKHPHTEHRQMIIERDGYAGVASPVKLSRTPASYRMPPPAFGQHQLELNFPSSPGS